jgi:hypothetical protein
MAGRRFGLCNAGEADVVYIRAQVGAARGEIRYRQERYDAPVCLALTQAAGIPVLAPEGLADRYRLTSLRRMR